MKPAFSTVACPEWTLDHLASIAEPWGYMGVELRTFGWDSRTFACDPALTSASKVRHMFDHAGLFAASLATGLRYDEPIQPVIGHVFQQGTHESVQRTKAAVDLAVSLECPFVRVFGFELPPGEKRTRGIDRIAQRLNDALAYCRNSGVRLALENGGSFSTAADLAELIDAVGNPLLASCYSIPVGLAAGDYPVRGVNVLADTLEIVKVKDLRDGKPCALGQGSIDSRPALAALAQLSFTGWVVYEYDRAWLPAGRSEDVAKVLETSAATLYSWIGPKAITSRPGAARRSRLSPPGRA